MMAQNVPHQTVATATATSTASSNPAATTATATTAAATADRKRVKVYELRNNDWFDRGTGFCSACFVVIEEGQPKEPRVIVQSEDQPDRLLLETKIVKDDGFQKQQDTLIVWTDHGVDMALSFQEAEGCQTIWKFIDGVQQTFHAVMGGPDDMMDIPAVIQLPPAELGALADMENVFRHLAQSQPGREVLAKAVVTEDYIPKLGALVELAEDLESLVDLHRLCGIMKTILMLNDTAIIEIAVTDECILGVVGAMEYDPDFPSHKANHRQWLNDQGRFKEVVRIQDDTVRRKIHHTYRLQYLKDVVLARILDDPTFSVLNSLIFFNQVDIVQHLNSTPGYMTDLFAVFHNPNEEPQRKKEAVLFIQQCCAIAKNIQPPSRAGLYGNFLQQGLLSVINFGLRHTDVTVRIGATDVLISMIDHDPVVIRKTIYDSINRKSLPLTDTLIDLLLVEIDLGIRSQISETLKLLLDPTPPNGPQERGGFVPDQGRPKPQPTVDPQQELFLTYFYEHSAVKLFRPLLDLEHRPNMHFNSLEDGVFGYLNDILCFYIRQHQHRSKFFILNYNIAQRFAQLLECKQKHLQLVAIRFFRQLVILQDEFYIKHLVEKKVFGPILDALLRTLPRDNLVSSACLELFAQIMKDNIKDLIKHVVETYREKLNLLSGIDLFRETLIRYDLTQASPKTIDRFFADAEDELTRRPANAGRGMMEHLSVDPAQEEYWNTSDDEEENQGPATNGNLLKPLVEYTSDEEDDGSGDALMTVDSVAAEEAAASKENQEPTSKSAPTTPTPTTAPPERLSEKRRREEDEDDALDKLMQHKRRNSSSSSTTGSNSSMSGTLVQKKSSFNNGKPRSREGSPSPNGVGGPRKIAISISPSIKTAAVETASEGGAEENGK
ncbi:component of IIS longevity pathway SMK-1-domain-containing protein [Podospora australis]|uniref:Component of IIS longevity pathway SMK-1-domain-containing protein n=1 Tax=Podospora australis TaxID=1536484 RepID=A0AAN7AQE9_9PEZI|nr:component of IIS longevity pathway SMK-1-domain-containing protein [Podospora australis]